MDKEKMLEQIERTLKIITNVIVKDTPLQYLTALELAIDEIERYKALVEILTIPRHH